MFRSTRAVSLPNGQLALAVIVPHGRDSTSVLASICRERAIHRPIIDPRTGQPVYVHPHPIRVIGSEYAAGRNELVRLIFDAEIRITADYQEAEDVLAKSQSRASATVPPMTFDFSLWLDDEVMPPETIIEQLLAHDVQICSGLYFMRKPPYLPVAYTLTGDPDYPNRFWNLTAYPKEALIEVDAAGMGCVLIATDVFRKIPKPWFAWGTPDVTAPTPAERNVLAGKWDALWNEYDHRSMGEDMYFYTKAKQYGFRTHLSTGTVCQHLGEQPYDESFFEQHQIHYYRLPPAGRMAILFLVVPSPKPWDGRSLYDEPLGGSESCVAYLARSLARLHHVVFVVCNTREGQVVDVDGVCYRPYASLQGALQHSWDAVIVVRWPDAVTYQMSDDVKSLIFWAHDLMQPQDMMKAYGCTIPDQDATDVFVSLTKFHQTFTTITSWDRAARQVMPNGLDLSLFQGTEPRDPNQLLWTSNPNRGLFNAVRIFRRLRRDYPELTFHIYGRSSVYGWGPNDPLHERHYLPKPDEPGVFLHDPLPKPQLAREYMKSWGLFYPTTWPESFCLAVTEAQCAGTPVIAVPYAALPETVQGGLLSYDVEGIFHQLRDDPKEWERLSLKGLEFTRHLSWDALALRWVEMIKAVHERRKAEGRMVG